MGQAGKIWGSGAEVEGSTQAGSCVQSLEGGVWARQSSRGLGKSKQEAQSISVAEGGHSGEGEGLPSIEDSGLRSLTDVGSRPAWPCVSRVLLPLGGQRGLARDRQALFPLEAHPRGLSWGWG